MAQVRIDPKSQNFPYLEAGKYGPGCDVEAECEVMEYEVAEDADGNPVHPPYDPQNERGPWAFIRIQVRPAEGQLVNLRHYEPIAKDSGSKMLGWITNLGVNVAEDGTHDSNTVPGLKCGVECGEPRSARDNPDRKFTVLRDVFGIS